MPALYDRSTCTLPLGFTLNRSYARVGCGKVGVMKRRTHMILTMLERSLRSNPCLLLTKAEMSWPIVFKDLPTGAAVDALDSALTAISTIANSLGSSKIAEVVLALLLGSHK